MKRLKCGDEVAVLPQAGAAICFILRAMRGITEEMSNLPTGIGGCGAVG